MRKLINLSPLILLAFLATFQVGVTSCTKEIVTHDTVILIRKDTTVQIKIDTMRLVQNEVPVVNPGKDSIIQLSTSADSIQVSGSATDPDSSVVSYLWSQVSGPNTALITNPGAASTYITKLTSGTYVFQLMAIDSEGAVGVKRVSVTILAPQLYTLTLQPDGQVGQDAIVAIRNGDWGAVANGNHSYIPEFSMSQWTYNEDGAGEGTNRTYVKFIGLAGIPAGAEIVSAKLSLYGLTESETLQSKATPQGNSFFTGSYNDSNKVWIKRVVGGDWNESTINWNNKPATTDINQVEINASTSRYNYNVTDLDISSLVRDIIASGNNYGFCLQLQTEQIYRCMLFASSEFPDPVKRPKLVIQYNK